MIKGGGRMTKGKKGGRGRIGKGGRMTNGKKNGFKIYGSEFFYLLF